MYQTSARPKQPVRHSRRTQGWVYNGRPVFIVPTAEISPGFRPGEKYGKLVQSLLNGLEPWELDKGQGPIETTFDNPFSLPAIVTRNNGRKPVWGLHVKHTARNPQLSPFMHGSGEIEITNSLTVELVGTITQPRLTRVYPGEYIPPLPWQSSAGDADGGMEACHSYWLTHSYIYDRSVIKKGTQTNTVPEWYK